MSRLLTDAGHDTPLPADYAALDFLATLVAVVEPDGTCLFVNANGIHYSGESSINWLTIGGLNVDFGLKLDALSMMMLFVVTGVGGLIHILIVIAVVVLIVRLLQGRKIF